MLEAGDRRLRAARVVGAAVRRRFVLRDRACTAWRICSSAACSARSACCRRRSSWARRFRRSRAGWRRRRRASPGSASSTAATSPARCSAACSPASISCASTTWRTRRTSPSSIDVVVARASLALARATAYHRRAMTTTRRRSDVAALARFRRAPGRSTSTIGLSGATALAAEAVWTRLLSLLLGATTYTFSLILAAFLLGLGIGSSVGSVRRAHGSNESAHRARRVSTAADGGDRVGRVLDDAQMLPYWPVSPGLSRRRRTARSRSTWCAACGRCCRRRCSGARASRSRSRPSVATRRIRRVSSATVYAANTIGGIIGALFGSLLIIAWLGTQDAQRMLIAVGGDQRARSRSFRRSCRAASKLDDHAARIWSGARSRRSLARAAHACRVPPVPPLLVGYGRWFATRLDERERLHLHGRRA